MLRSASKSTLTSSNCKCHVIIRNLTVPFTEQQKSRPCDAIASNFAFGDYEVLEEIGRGGMGVVYKAIQRSLSRTVALKVLIRGQSPSASDLARFRTETESAARLDHPAIVPIYEVGEQTGQPYFTMKYVAGTTLTRQLADGPIGARQAAIILAPICRAVDTPSTGRLASRLETLQYPHRRRRATARFGFWTRQASGSRRASDAFGCSSWNAVLYVA